MFFSRVQVEPYSVTEVINDASLDGQVVSVHGIFYYGEGSQKGEILIYEKEGPFDGDLIPMPDSLDRSKCLLVEEPNIESRLSGWGAVGDFIYKSDTIIVGKVRRCPESDHPVRIGNLWLLLIQRWTDVGRGKHAHKLSLIGFPENAPPIEEWRSPAKRMGFPSVDCLPAQPETRGKKGTS